MNKKQKARKMQDVQQNLIELIAEYFNMTDVDGKPEDYRKPTPFWYSRLCLYDGQKKSQKFWEFAATSFLGFDTSKVTFIKFEFNVMTLGYPKKEDKSRIKIFEHAGIEIREGREEWGAEKGKLYFVVKHGKRIQ